ncbi:DUF4307 domain-containing protein [Nocardia sp. CNY236]|uniref:DUF4307 domain-containing protein n=1 Tax=Nocardia sp. CNY236 TaxID=1169152 RepID=UPI0003FD4363|nr:DUF4307 domain-containing protein [Nocardia sp. CNY236]
MSEPAPEAADATRASDPASSNALTDRYGTPPRRRRWIALVLGGLVVLAGVGIAYLGFQKFGPQDIEAKQLSYTLVDESTIDIRFKVTRADPSRPVVCFIRAMSRDATEVGRREVLIAPSSSGTVELTTTVRASERPAAGSVYGCSDQVPSYLRAD